MGLTESRGKLHSRARQTLRVNAVSPGFPFWLESSKYLSILIIHPSMLAKNSFHGVAVALGIVSCVSGR
jgi:hypothetical protein